MNDFTNTETKRETTSPEIGQSAESPGGPGRDGNKPLMRNRRPNLASPIGNNSGDIFRRAMFKNRGITTNS